MDPEVPRIEYVEARRVLLDVLEALQDHIGALVLVGAQAVYLRSEGRMAGYQAFTTDSDVVLDPTKLGPTPPLGRAMEAAGFVMTAEPGIWEARFRRSGFDDDVVVPIDLIVPEQLAPRAGRRSARLPGDHGKASARKSPGLEGAVVDNGPIEIAALDESDPRRITVNVAGVGALLVAKAFKLGERLATPERLQAKDAGDVYRLFDATSVDEMADLLQVLLLDQRSSRTTELALGYTRKLFLMPSSVGVQLAIQALRGTLPEATVTASITSYVQELLAQLDR